MRTTNQNLQQKQKRESNPGDFPGGPVVKNLPSSAWDVSSIAGRGTRFQHATGKLSPDTSTREPVGSKLQSPRALEPMCRKYRAHVLCSLRATTREEKKPTRHEERSRMPQRRFHVLQQRSDAPKKY